MIRTVRESYLLFKRNMKKTLRTPMLLFFSLAQPMLWLVLFSQIFKKFGDFPQFRALGYDSYLQFFVAGVLGMTMLTSSFQSGMGMVNDIDSGMLDKFMISPIRRSSILLGKVMADGFRMFLQGVVVVLVALLLGARIETGVPGILLLLVLGALFGIAWAGLSNIVALRTKNAEMTMMLGILLTFPVLFLSTAMMPKALLPHWIETVGKYNPVTYVIDSSRYLINFGYDWTLIAKTAGVIAIVAVVTFTGATRAFKKATT